MTAIEIDNLRVSFTGSDEAHHVVKGVSLSIAKGETFGLVGESGCGKSTILRCISGLIEDWSGSITIHGQTVSHHRSRKEFRATQMVFQDPYGSLHPKHTVNTTLLEPLKIHRMDRRNERVAEALDKVGLGPSFRYRYPHQLSGGQRQRVALARALILEPQALLLDEPTSSLDVSVQAEILNLLCDLREALGLTYLLVSHNLAVIAHMCSRIAVMHDGAVLEELTVDDLRHDRCQTPHTLQLLAASRGYRQCIQESACPVGSPA